MPPRPERPCRERGRERENPFIFLDFPTPLPPFFVPSSSSRLFHSNAKQRAPNEWPPPVVAFLLESAIPRRRRHFFHLSFCLPFAQGEEELSVVGPVCMSSGGWGSDMVILLALLSRGLLEGGNMSVHCLLGTVCVCALCIGEGGGRTPRP